MTTIIITMMMMIVIIIIIIIIIGAKNKAKLNKFNITLHDLC